MLRMLRFLPPHRSLLPHCSTCWLPPPPSDNPRTSQPSLLHLPPALFHPHIPSHTRQISTSRTLARKEGIMVRFKQMVKDYWYVIIPVEITTSLVWYGSIFISLKSGVDLVEILTNMGVSEEVLGKLPDAGGNYGYHAITFVCYKVISPIRHGLSLAISAALVTRLNKTYPGYLRTSSSIAKEARETGEEIKDKAREKGEEIKDKARERGEEMKDRYDEKLAEGKEKMDGLKSKAEEKRSEVKKDLKERMEGWRKEK
eukprot:GFUD01016948.1.p1 GENE.GFUD01016948.1~~GFUD01016948.1.p1  ORF type:complete len:257 (-),score=84.37 GFUD01016948.1:56-826(-)